MFHLTTIGDALIDLFFLLDEKNPCCRLNKDKKQLCFLYGEKMSIQKSAMAVGGNAANVAVGAKKLGLSSAIIASVGDDLNGHTVLETLEKSGVDTSQMRMEKNGVTRYSVVLTYKAERTILSYHSPHRYILPKKMHKTDWIYYTSMGAGFETLQKELEQYLVRHPEVQLAMNPGSYQLRFGLPAVKKILPRVAALFVNKEEVEKIVGKTGIRTTMTRLHRTGVKRIFLTDGERGSYSSDGSKILFFPPYPIQAVSKTGAGDAYTSGALSALIRGKTSAEAMQWGTANAALVVQKIGAEEGLATRAAIKKVMRRFPALLPETL